MCLGCSLFPWTGKFTGFWFVFSESVTLNIHMVGICLLMTAVEKLEWGHLVQTILGTICLNLLVVTRIFEDHVNFIHVSGAQNSVCRLQVNALTVLSTSEFCLLEF